MTQHDDHIWLTVMGGAWAIQSIERDEAGDIAFINLWRGYAPALEFSRLRVIEANWPHYCDAARDVIEAQLRPLV
jgi:hypothetical protein